MSLFATGGSGAVPIALTTFRTSKPSVSILCRPVSIDRATICTPPARLAVGATANVSASGATPALRRNPCGHIVGRKRASFEHQHAARGVLGVTELGEQLLLDARLRAQRARPHREETLRD